MIVNDKAAAERLNSPGNLINRMKSLTENNTRKNAMSLFIKPSVDISAAPRGEEKVKVTFNPFQTEKKEEIVRTPTTQPVGLDDISNDHDSKIKLGLAHDKALQLLTDSVKMLADKLDDVSPAKLPAVIAAASRTVESIRKERNESAKFNKDREVHYHFYTPQQRKIEEYEVIEVAQ